MNSASLLLLCLCCCSAVATGPASFQVSNPETGKEYDLKLTRAAENILHPNVKVIDVREDANGHLTFDSWEPSNEELHAAQDVYLDKDNLAAIRFRPDSNGVHEMEGVVDGQRIEKNVNGGLQLASNSNPLKTDYIDVGRNVTYSKTKQGGRQKAVVEVLLVCDMEWGDIFQHDRRRILDYLTVYFWDVNLRYQTLPSSDISFRITGVLVIRERRGQPFIEEARASDGRAEFGRILGRFAGWVYNQMGSLPKFDMAISITNTQLEWGGGLAYYRTACHINHDSRMHYATLVFNDDGSWGSATVGSHEIGHSLGAPHDDDPNFPGGCSDRGYIMSGGNEDLKWFFSTCSNRVMGDFIRSDGAACLQRQDENGPPAINPDFSSPLAPTMDEICKRRLKNDKAFIPADHDRGNCKVFQCWLYDERQNVYWIWNMDPVENTICKDNGRCFRGRCRPQGSLFQNVGTGKCMRDTNTFNHMTIIQMVDCIRPGTPLDKFTVTDSGSGKRLGTPWNTPDASENGDKCIWTGNREGDALWTDRCNPDNGWHGWDFVDVGNGEFMLSHRVTRRCARDTGAYIQTYENCNRNDRNMRWRLQ